MATTPAQFPAADCMATTPAHQARIARQLHFYPPSTLAHAGGSQPAATSQVGAGTHAMLCAWLLTAAAARRRPCSDCRAGRGCVNKRSTATAAAVMLKDPPRRSRQGSLANHDELSVFVPPHELTASSLLDPTNVSTALCLQGCAVRIAASQHTVHALCSGAGYHRHSCCATGTVQAMRSSSSAWRALCAPAAP